MKTVKRLLAGFVAVLIVSLTGYSAFAMVTSSSIPTQSYNLISDGDYFSSAYTNGYRLYTNYYFLGRYNRCHFYGTSYNASASYYNGIINYNTGYTYLDYRGSGTTPYEIDIKYEDRFIYPIGDYFYCGFNMTANSSEASNAFGVGCW